VTWGCEFKKLEFAKFLLCDRDATDFKKFQFLGNRAVASFL